MEAGRAFVDFAQSQADLINDLNDLSTRSGVAAESVHALQFAFMASGQAAGNVQQLLDQMPRVLAHAARGTGAISKAFDDLGLSVHNAQGELKTTDQMFEEITQSLQSIENPTLKATTAVEIFGRQAGNMLQAFGNVETLQTFRSFTEEFGVDIEEASRQAARFQQAMAALDIVIGKFGQTIASIFGEEGFVAPIKFAGQAINGLAALVGGVIDNTKRSFDGFLLDLRQRLLEFLDVVYGALNALSAFSLSPEAMRFTNNALNDISEGLEAVKAQQIELSRSRLTVRSDLGPIDAAIKAFKDYGVEIDNIMDKLGEAGAGSVAGDLNLPDQEVDVAVNVEEMNIDGLLDELNEDIEKSMSSSIQDIATEQAAARKIQEDFNKGIAAGISSISTPQGFMSNLITGLLGPIAPIVDSAMGLLVGFGEGVLAAFTAASDRAIELSTQSAQDLVGMRQDLLEEGRALDRGPTGLSQEVLRLEQANEKKRLQATLSALRGADGEEMERAREIAMMEAEIQAVTFANAIGQGIQMLPKILIQVLPEMLLQMAIEIVKAIFNLPRAIWEAIKGGFRSIVDALTLNIGDTIRDRIDEARKKDMSWFGLQIPQGQSGMRFTGADQGLAILHRNETVVPATGRSSQETRQNIQANTGQGLTIQINSLVTERSAIDELVRRIQTRYSTFGQATSPIFV